MNYSSCSIWDVGPGRPFDNIYCLKSIVMSDGEIEIFFMDSKCQIINPTGVSISEKVMEINQASKIIWEGIYYEKNPSQNKGYISQYEPMNNHEIKKATSGAKNEVSTFQTNLKTVKAFKLHCNGPIDKFLNK